MFRRKARSLRAPMLLLALCLILPPWGMKAAADDAELLAELPGQWVFSLSPDEDTEGDAESPPVDCALLSLGEDGTFSLLCQDTAGASLGTFEGAWSAELVPDGMDRLTLRFTSAEHPAYEADADVECTYDIYAESWVENDIQHTYLLLEACRCSGIPPFEAVYGENGQWPLALHREQKPNMRVIRCKDYVSLRAGRSKSSARLARVPLGALVLAFPEAGGENGFTWCVYHDEYGYILSEYLEPVE